LGCLERTEIRCLAEGPQYPPSSQIERPVATSCDEASLILTFIRLCTHRQASRMRENTLDAAAAGVSWWKRNELHRRTLRKLIRQERACILSTFFLLFCWLTEFGCVVICLKKQRSEYYPGQCVHRRSLSEGDRRGRRRGHSRGEGS
jgi:hypothetical protein